MLSSDFKSRDEKMKKFKYDESEILSVKDVNAYFINGGTVTPMEINEDDKVLDLGCCIGRVGRVAATKTKNKVILTDVNKRAVKLAKMNTRKIRTIKVLHGNAFEKIKEKFDVILFNPPQAAGKKICYAMIKDSKDFLLKDGTLQVVARHNKGGGSLSEYMESVFGNLKTIAKKGGYRVYVSKA